MVFNNEMRFFFRSAVNIWQIFEELRVVYREEKFQALAIGPTMLFEKIVYIAHQNPEYANNNEYNEPEHRTKLKMFLYSKKKRLKDLNFKSIFKNHYIII